MQNDKCDDIKEEIKVCDQCAKQQLAKASFSSESKPQSCNTCEPLNQIKCQLCGFMHDVNDLFCQGCVGRHSYY